MTSTHLVNPGVDVLWYQPQYRDQTARLLLACDSPIMNDSFDRLVRSTGSGTLCWVATRRHMVVGFAAARVEGEDLRIFDICVEPELRRQRVGTRIFSTILGKVLASMRVKRMVLNVDERNLDGQLFLRRLGFVASKILPCVPEGVELHEAKRAGNYREVYEMIFRPEWFQVPEV
jgi:GNAT superfamily N-acetyltransferase